MIFHIPHASRIIPSDLRTAILLNEEELNHELTLMTDAHTDELFAPHANEEDSVISFPVSRLIVDPERFLEDTEEKMSEVGMRDNRDVHN